MKESDNTKVGAFCSFALHATVALAAFVTVFAKAIIAPEDPPIPPTVFDMVDPAQPPAPAPTQQGEKIELEQPTIEKLDDFDLPEPEPEPEPAPPNQMPEVLAAQVTEESDLDAPGRKKRHSIANDNPKALEEAVNDPFIHEVVDLFGGSVVDIHR